MIAFRFRATVHGTKIARFFARDASPRQIPIEVDAQRAERGVAGLTISDLNKRHADFYRRKKR